MTRALLPLVLLLGAAGCVIASAPPPAPVMPPIHDTNIVPPHRAGPISIGMTEAQLFEAMGNPTESHPSMGPTVNTIYRWGNLSAWVAPRSGRVDEIWIDDPAYSLPSGVRVGSSALEVKAKLGAPAWARTINPFNYSYCYDDGTMVEMLTREQYQFNAVTSIVVCGCIPHGRRHAPGCVE